MSPKKTIEPKKIKTKIKPAKVTKAKSKTTESTKTAVLKKTLAKKSGKNPIKMSVKTAAKEAIKEIKSGFPSVEITIKRRISGEVPETHHFYLNDGRQLGSMYDLVKALDDMTDDVFTYHVNDFKNDFSNWIKDVMKDDILAGEIAEARNRAETQVKLLKHMVKKVID